MALRVATGQYKTLGLAETIFSRLQNVEIGRVLSKTISICCYNNPSTVSNSNKEICHHQHLLLKRRQNVPGQLLMNTSVLPSISSTKNLVTIPQNSLLNISRDTYNSLQQQKRNCSTEDVEEDDEEKKSKVNSAEANKNPIFGRGALYRPVDVETSLRYMDSEAYNETYGDLPVWHHFRPNHPYGRPRMIPRKTCVRGGVIATGSPCPICRDDHLVLDYSNVKLLKQFMAPSEQHIFEAGKTQICMKQYKRLLVAIEKAKDVGLLEEKDLGFRAYDYADYYDSLKEIKTNTEERKDSFIAKVLRQAVAEKQSST